MRERVRQRAAIDRILQWDRVAYQLPFVVGTAVNGGPKQLFAPVVRPFVVVAHFVVPPVLVAPLFRFS